MKSSNCDPDAVRRATALIEEAKAILELEVAKTESMLTHKQKEWLWSCIDDKGFWYAFRHYSDYRDITDPKFRELKDTFVDAGEALNEYIDGDDRDPA